MDCSNYRKDKVGVYALMHLREFITESLVIESKLLSERKRQIQEKQKAEIKEQKQEEKKKKEFQRAISFKSIEKEFKNLLRF